MIVETDTSDAHPLAGRSALVTGSSRNLGSVIAKTLALNGAGVVVSYTSSRSDAESLVDALRGQTGGSHTALRFKAEDADSVRDLVESSYEALGGLDILVNNVGPWRGGAIKDAHVSEWRLVFDTNLTAAWIASKTAIGFMERAGWGRILNISAGSAFMRNHSTYGLAKRAMITLTEEMAVAAENGVTVNCIAPGQIAESTPELGEDEAEIVSKTLDRTATGKLVTRQEIADVAVLLCTDTFSSLNGVTLALDGGWHINRF